MCVPVCGWCLAWQRFSCLSIKHPVFGKPHNILSYSRHCFFLSRAELQTHSSLWLRTRKHRFPVAQKGLWWLELMYIHRKSVHINKLYCTTRLFFLFFCTPLFSSSTLFSSPSRARHSTQRQCAGSSFPERVPAGHGIKPNRGILLRTGPSFPAELYIQVQGYRGWGPETSVTPWVPQRIAPGRGFTQVRAQTYSTWQQDGYIIVCKSLQHNTWIQ